MRTFYQPSNVQIVITQSSNILKIVLIYHGSFVPIHQNHVGAIRHAFFV